MNREQNRKDEGVGRIDGLESIRQHGKYHPPSTNPSVTEGTTELLLSSGERRVAEPIPRKKSSTAEIEPERLM